MTYPEKTSEDFLIIVSDYLMTLVENKEKFNPNEKLKDFTFTDEKYKGMISIKDYQSFSILPNKICNYSVVIYFMENKGYIEKDMQRSDENNIYYYTYILTEEGRIAKGKGGHYQYLEYSKLDETLKQQILKVNQSVLDTNDATRNNIKIQKLISYSSLLVSAVSVSFIVISTTKSCNDKTSETTNTKLEYIQKELQNNRTKADSIFAYLIEKGFLSPPQKLHTPTNKGSIRK